MLSLYTYTNIVQMEYVMHKYVEYVYNEKDTFYINQIYITERCKAEGNQSSCCNSNMFSFVFVVFCINPQSWINLSQGVVIHCKSYRFQYSQILKFIVKHLFSIRKRMQLGECKSGFPSGSCEFKGLIDLEMDTLCSQGLQKLIL